MDDDFEYSILDYAVGRIQVRPEGSKDYFSGPVFWVKLRVTNKADHLIRTPRYFHAVSSFRVVDNWGNVYWLEDLGLADVGGSWHGAKLPIPGDEGKRRYKPGESSWAVRRIPVGDFVEGIKELRVYLTSQFEATTFYFRIEEPMVRRKDLLRDQDDPKPSELRIMLVAEKSVPAQKKPARKRKG